MECCLVYLWKLDETLLHKVMIFISSHSEGYHPIVLWSELENNCKVSEIMW